MTQKFNIYEEVRKLYPKYPTDVLLDMFRPIKKYKKLSLPDLSGKFELTHFSVGKMGLIRILDELKSLTKSEWNQIIDLIPQMKEELSKRYNAKSLKNDLAKYAQRTRFFGHVSAVRNDESFQYICVDHLKLFDTGENIGSNVDHIWLQKITKYDFKIGDFIIFDAYSFRYKSENIRKFGLRLVNDDSFQIISLKEAKQWYNEKKEEARNIQIQTYSKFYGKPKTYHKFQE